MKYKDYYIILGVPREANLEQIKKAYRQLARTYHPDLSKLPDTEARFKEAAEAYATLKNARKRAAYDELGYPASGADFAPPPQWRQDLATGDVAFDDLDLVDRLAALGRGQQGARNVPRPGAGTGHRERNHSDTGKCQLRHQGDLEAGGCRWRTHARGHHCTRCISESEVAASRPWWQGGWRRGKAIYMV